MRTQILLFLGIIVGLIAIRCNYLYAHNGTLLAPSIREKTAHEICGKDAYFEGRNLHLKDSVQWLRYKMFEEHFDYHGIDSVIVYQ